LLAEGFEPGDAIGSDLHMQGIGFEQALQGPLHGAGVFYDEYGVHSLFSFKCVMKILYSETFVSFVRFAQRLKP
jgi:hypothetical protein